MRHPRFVLAAVAIAAVGLAATSMLVMRTPASAPMASSAPTPGGSTHRIGAPPEAVPWQRVGWLPPISDPLGPPDPLRRIDGVVGAGDRIIGWGRSPMPGRNQFNDMGAIFLSADAVTWTTVPIAHGVGPENASSIVEVAVGPLGYLAVGSVCCTPEEPALWLSADGLAWERIAPGGALNPMEHVLTSVVALPDGWLALGGSRVAPGATIWQSDDGEAWERVLEVGEGGSFPPISDIVATSTGVMAVGTVVGDGGSYDGGIWSSVDGRSWERVAIEDPALVGEGEVQLSRVWSHAGGLFALGVHGTAEQRRRCEDLVGMLAALGDRPPPPPPDATSCQSGEERTWASRDALAWEMVAPGAGPGAQPTEFRVVAAGGPGLVVLGESSMPASPDTMLFTSPDGVSWSEVDDGMPMHADMAIGLVVRGDTIVAVTDLWADDRTTTRVWIGHAE